VAALSSETLLQKCRSSSQAVSGKELKQPKSIRWDQKPWSWLQDHRIRQGIFWEFPKFFFFNENMETPKNSNQEQAPICLSSTQKEKRLQ
jgi:hypothetical protein